METKAVKKTAAPKAAPKAKAETVKAEAPKKAPAAKSGKTLVVVQTGSQTSVKPGMVATLKGLGLGKPRSRRELLDTPETRGMLWKVRHLVKVEGE